MSEEPSKVQSASAGGLAAKTDPPEAIEVLVGPATADQFNTARIRLIPVACWRVDDVRFDFDSSFVLPNLRQEMKQLAKLIKAHTKTDLQNSNQPPPLSIFGHADPVGRDDYNKALSGRRAAAIYGMLTRRDEVWEDLFSSGGAFAQPAAGDKWGTRAIRTMLGELGIPFSGESDQNAETKKAVKEFQSQNGLAADGSAGPATRKALYLAYMDKLCVDSQGVPFSVDRTEGFLGRNVDRAGKADFQGCGEFNPVLIFSSEDNKRFEQAKDKTERDEANAPNRRVMALLFRPGSRVDPNQWPCPRAKEGTAGCVKRFWSDSDRRRNTRLPDQPRKFETKEDTFGCRFYQRLSGASPCERALKSFRVRLYDGFGTSMPFAPHSVSIGSQPFSDVEKADEKGVVILRDIEVPATCVIKWGFPPKDGADPDLMFDRKIFLVASDEAVKVAEKKKLSNLGYEAADASENILGFQLDYGHLVDPPLDATGDMDDRTSELLDKVYEQSADDLKETT